MGLGDRLRNTAVSVGQDLGVLDRPHPPAHHPPNPYSCGIDEEAPDACSTVENAKIRVWHRRELEGDGSDYTIFVGVSVGAYVSVHVTRNGLVLPFIRFAKHFLNPWPHDNLGFPIYSTRYVTDAKDINAMNNQTATADTTVGSAPSPDKASDDAWSLGTSLFAGSIVPFYPESADFLKLGEFRSSTKDDNITYELPPDDERVMLRSYTVERTSIRQLPGARTSTPAGVRESLIGRPSRAAFAVRVDAALGLFGIVEYNRTKEPTNVPYRRYEQGKVAIYIAETINVSATGRPALVPEKSPNFYSDILFFPLDSDPDTTTDGSFGKFGMAASGIHNDRGDFNLIVSLGDKIQSYNIPRLRINNTVRPFVAFDDRPMDTLVRGRHAAWAQDKEYYICDRGVDSSGAVVVALALSPKSSPSTVATKGGLPYSCSEIFTFIMETPSDNRATTTEARMMPKIPTVDAFEVYEDEDADGHWAFTSAIISDIGNLAVFTSMYFPAATEDNHLTGLAATTNERGSGSRDTDEISPSALLSSSAINTYTIDVVVLHTTVEKDEDEEERYSRKWIRAYSFTPKSVSSYLYRSVNISGGSGLNLAMTLSKYNYVAISRTGRSIAFITDYQKSGGELKIYYKVAVFSSTTFDASGHTTFTDDGLYTKSTGGLYTESTEGTWTTTEYVYKTVVVAQTMSVTKGPIVTGIRFVNSEGTIVTFDIVYDGVSCIHHPVALKDGSTPPPALPDDAFQTSEFFGLLARKTEIGETAMTEAGYFVPEPHKVFPGPFAVNLDFSLPAYRFPESYRRLDRRFNTNSFVDPQSGTTSMQVEFTGATGCMYLSEAGGDYGGAETGPTGGVTPAADDDKRAPKSNIEAKPEST